MKKYAVYPGFITSQTDGDRHFISARPDYILTSDRRATEDLIALSPQYDGEYNSPNE